MEPEGELVAIPGDLQLPIDVEAVGDELVVAVVHGSIDLHEATELRAVLNDACTGPHRSVAVDLSAVHFIGSTGMGVLARVHHELARDHRQLIVVGASEAIRRAFEVAGLAQLLAT